MRGLWQSLWGYVELFRSGDVMVSELLIGVCYAVIALCLYVMVYGIGGRYDL